MFVIKNQGRQSYYVGPARMGSITITHERGYAKVFATREAAESVIETVRAGQASRKFHERNRLMVVSF